MLDKINCDDCGRVSTACDTAGRLFLFPSPGVAQLETPQGKDKKWQQKLAGQICKRNFIQASLLAIYLFI